MPSKLYSKTGDEGTASLYTGERRSKDDAVFNALGDIDELNSAVGLAADSVVDAHTKGKGGESFLQVRSQLQSIQSRLLDTGSAVATPLDSNSSTKLQRAAFDGSCAQDLERWIDDWQDTLPALTNFILPGGGLAASNLHMARAICRRAERSVTPLIAGDVTDKAVGIYLNRLSDYLFVAARRVALSDTGQEVVYKKAAG